MQILSYIMTTTLLVVVFTHSLTILLDMRCRSQLSTNTHIEMIKRLNTVNKDREKISCQKTTLFKQLVQKKVVLKERERAKFQTRYKKYNKNFIFFEKLINKEDELRATSKKTRKYNERKKI